MIYYTGDIHGDPIRRFEDIDGENLTKDDYMIIAGDFGCLWRQEMSLNEISNIRWLDDRPWTTLFIDGNHENYNRLNSYPVEEWHGGKVHKISSSVIHLMRGEIYDIDGLSVFTMGGARSHDIKDGILQPDDPRISKWRYDYFKMFRVDGISWWKEEMPNPDELEYAWNNLAKHNFDVDVIVTHEAPKWALPRGLKWDSFNEFLELIRLKTNYGLWVNGHYHMDYWVSKKHRMIYDDVAPLPLHKDAEKEEFPGIEFVKDVFDERQVKEYEEIMSRADEKSV